MSQLGTSTLVTRDEAGQERTSVVSFVLVWQRQDDGRWLIILDAWH